MKKVGLIISVGAAIASVGLGQLYFQRLEAEVSGGPKVAVLVAAVDVPVGATLTEARLAVRDIPQAYVEGRQVKASELKKVVGGRVTGGLRANETLLWTDLAKFSDHSRVLSGLVQQGSRAVALDGRSSDFQGLLRPGDRVDVLLTTGEKAQGGTTITLLQNLLVLSVGSNIARVDEDGAKNGLRGGVTVSATLEQAQLLAQAEQHGRLTLVLRNSDDITVIEGLPETNGANLLSSKDAPTSVRAVTKGAIDHVR
jgi:pilus assembly protein CpaB